MFPKREKTSIEQKFEQFLIQNNIKFEPQYLFCEKRYDFYLTELQLLVEVDGEFWHRQPSSIKNDIKKHSDCLQHGRELVRISSNNFNPGIIFMDKETRQKHTRAILENRGIYGFY